MALQGPNSDSWTDFGVIDPTQFTSTNDIAWLPILNATSFWTNKITAIRFRHQISGNWPTYALTVQSAYSYALGDNYAIVDSGTSCLIVPGPIFKFIQKALLDTLITYEADTTGGGWGFFFSCT